MRNLILFFCFFYFSNTTAQIIDVHLHSYDSTDYWGGRTHPTGISSPPSVDDHLARTIELMDKNNIEYAVISGNTIEGVEKYSKADPRFIPAYGDGFDNLIPIDQFEKLIKEERIKVFGEIASTYFGKTLNDPVFEPYLAICEKYNIPVAYHSGGFPPMTPYRCCPKARISIADPLLIEDVLVKYPKLKIYLMHGGEMYYEHAIRMMKMYNQLYIDLGVLLWVDPMTQDYAIKLLKDAKEYGLLERVMFGSDQMVWPGSITTSIEFLKDIKFLTQEEKQLIFYENAKKFLDL